MQDSGTSILYLASCILHLFLPLAVRAPGRGAAADGLGADSGAAAQAGFALAAVNLEIDREVAGVAVRRREITERGAARGDGLGQHLLDRFGESPEPGVRDPVAGAARVDSSPPQGLGGVYVADAGDQALVQKKRLDGCPPLTDEGRQRLQEPGVQGLHAQSTK